MLINYIPRSDQIHPDSRYTILPLPDKGMNPATEVSI